jgi:hypothetical protein
LDEMRKIDDLPMMASYQVLIHLARRLQRRRFLRNQPIIKKNGLWWPCLLTDRDEMSNLYRGHSIDASYQVSVPSATAWPNESKLGRKPSLEGHLFFSFHPDPFTNMAATCHSCV